MRSKLFIKVSFAVMFCSAWLSGAGICSCLLDIRVPAEAETYEWRVNGAAKVYNSTSGTRMRVGCSGGSGDLSVVYPFEIPVLGSDMDIEQASLSFVYIRQKEKPDFAVDVWLMGTGPASAFLNKDRNFGKAMNCLKGKRQKLQEAFVDNTTPQKSRSISINHDSQESLLEYLHEFYANNPGYAGGQYLLVSLTPSIQVGRKTVGYEFRSAIHDTPPEMKLTIGPSSLVAARRMIWERSRNANEQRVWKIGKGNLSASEFKGGKKREVPVWSAVIDTDKLDRERVLSVSRDIPAEIKGSISNNGKISRVEIKWNENTEGYRVFLLHSCQSRTFLGRPDELMLQTPDGAKNYFDLPSQRSNTFAQQRDDIEVLLPLEVKAGENRLVISIPRLGSVASIRFDSMELLSISEEEYREQVSAKETGKVFSEHLEKCAVAYNKAMFRSARIRDKIEQCMRLEVYSAESGNAEKFNCPKLLEKDLVSTEKMLGADRSNTSFYCLDYARIERSLDDLEKEVEECIGNAPSELFKTLPPALAKDNAPEGILKRFTIAMHPVGIWSHLDRIGDDGVSAVFANYTGGRFPKPSFFMDLVDKLEELGYSHMWKMGSFDIYGEALKDGGYDRELTFHGEGQPENKSRYREVNFWHPRIRKATTDLVRKTAIAAKDFPHFYGYELFNEPNIDATGKETSVRKAWYEWLVKKYGVVDTLNQAWGTSFKEFAEIDPPSLIYPKVGISREQTAKIYYWDRFRSESYNDYNKEIIKTIREYDSNPSHIIIPQIIASVFGHHHSNGHNGVDLYSYGALDWSAISSHAWDGNRAPKTSLTTYSIARLYDKPIWEDEYIWSAWSRKFTPEREMRHVATRNIWKKIAWGARGIHLFNTSGDQGETGSNWNNASVSTDDGSMHMRFAVGAMPVIEKKVNLFNKYYYGMWMKWQGLGILQPDTSLVVAAPNMTCRDEADALMLYLLPKGYRPVNYPEQAFVDGKVPLDELKVLLVPYAPNILPEASRVILKWIHDGGTLLASGPVGGFDETGKKTPELLKTLFGIDGIRYAGNDIARAREENFNIVHGLDTKGRKWAISGSTAQAVKIINTYEDGSPRTLAVNYGKGRCVMNLETFSGTKSYDVLLSEINRVLPERMVTASAEPCDWTLWQNRSGEQQVLFIFNNDTKKGGTFDVCINNEVDSLWDMTVERPAVVPLRKSHNKCYFKTLLGPGGGAVFLVEKPAK